MCSVKCEIRNRALLKVKSGMDSVKGEVRRGAGSVKGEVGNGALLKVKSRMGLY